MKKKLEADLISIAHRILKLKNKSELDQLLAETRQLYERLAVLQFVENHFAEAKPTIGQAEVSGILETAFATENEIPAATETTAPEAEPESVTETEITQPETVSEEAEAADEEHEAQPEAEAETAEPETDDAPEENESEPERETPSAPEKPSFDLDFEAKETPKKDAPKQISIEDLLGGYTEPVFEKVSDQKPAPEPEVAAEPETAVTGAEATETEHDIQPEAEVESTETADETEVQDEPEEAPTPEPESKPEPSYEPVKPATGTLHPITFGLNDRIGFERNLFGGSAEDMNRVISQLSTFDSFEEARQFIDDMVRPDYNNWEGKDDYAQRFLDIVERRFN